MSQEHVLLDGGRGRGEGGERGGGRLSFVIVARASEFAATTGNAKRGKKFKIKQQKVVERTIMNGLCVFFPSGSPAELRMQQGEGFFLSSLVVSPNDVWSFSLLFLAPNDPPRDGLAPPFLGAPIFTRRQMRTRPA